MKKHLRNLAVMIMAASAVLAGSNRVAAVDVYVDPGKNWLGYMNVYELPANGGAYLWGSGWGIADLNASFSATVLTLTPNTIGDTSSYWYTPSGGPGATGNKTMDANLYVEETGLLSGQTVTFSGVVLANTLVSPYTSVAFIKDFAPDWSSFTSATVPLADGAFSISLATDPAPGRHVQYGFETIGPNVWVTDVASKGYVQIALVPEPASLSLLSLGLLCALCLRAGRR